MSVISLLSDDLSDKPGFQEVIDLVSSSPPSKQAGSPKFIAPSANTSAIPYPAKILKLSGSQSPGTILEPCIGLSDCVMVKAPSTSEHIQSSPHHQLFNDLPKRVSSKRLTSLDSPNKTNEENSIQKSRDSTPTELASRLDSAKEIKDRITAYLRETKSPEEGNHGWADTVPDDLNTADPLDLKDSVVSESPFRKSFSSNPGLVLDAAYDDSTSILPVEPKLHLSKTDTINDAEASRATHRNSKKRSKPVFRDNTVSDFTTSTAVKPAVAATSISDRRKAARSLRCQLWTSSSDWVSDLRQEFDTLEVEIEICQKEPLPIEGAVLVLAVHGTYEDTWSCEHQTFVKSARHDEDLGSAIVVLNAEFMDSLGQWSVSRRNEYFLSTRMQVSNQCCQKRRDNMNIIFMIPELGAYYTRQVDKFNRDMRRRIAIQSQNFVTPSNDENGIKRPDEQFYANLESELQIVHNLRAHYPRKRLDCVEMISNCVIDFGFQRYQANRSQTNDTYGGSVRSKVTLRDVCVESLTQIQGLPPRIATSLIDEAPSLGKLLEVLGTNTEMRESRIKRFGKGNWNVSLLKFLQCADATDLI